MISDVFNTIIIQAFGANYILFIIAIFLLLAIIMFTYRFSGAEALIVATIFTGALFLSSINPIFTALFALIILLDAIVFILAIWKQLANG